MTQEVLVPKEDCERLEGSLDRGIEISSRRGDFSLTLNREDLKDYSLGVIEKVLRDYRVHGFKCSLDIGENGAVERAEIDWSL